MSHHNGPRPGSRPFLGLQALMRIGGQAMSAEWLNTMRWAGEKMGFQSLVVNPLMAQRMVILRGYVYHITDAGREHLGVDAAGEPAAPRAPAGPRYVAPMRELSRKNMPNVRLTREGAFDYRDIPSLHGAQRTAFQSDLTVLGEGSKG